MATPLKEIAANKSLFHKLHPSRFPRMSGFMVAVVGYVLDIRFVGPAIAEIAITSDGFVLARAEGDTRTNFVGEYSDLIRNWNGLLVPEGLTQIERLEAQSLFACKVGYYGETTA